LSAVKRQHYVPQFLLREFLNGDGKLSVYVRGKGHSFRAAPENVACQRYYNAAKLDSGEIDTQTIEKELSQIEAAGSEVMRLLVSGTSPTSEQRAQFALFLTSQDFRSPRRRQEFADLRLGIEHQKFPTKTVSSVESYVRAVTEASEIEKKLDLANISEESELKVEDDGLITMGFEGTVRALSAAEHFAPIVAKMDWHIFRAPKSNGYIISDSPIQLYESPATLEKHSGPAYWRQGSYI